MRLGCLLQYFCCFVQREEHVMDHGQSLFVE